MYCTIVQTHQVDIGPCVKEEKEESSCISDIHFPQGQLDSVSGIGFVCKAKVSRSQSARAFSHSYVPKLLKQVGVGLETSGGCLQNKVGVVFKTNGPCKKQFANR
jgi:hypothetical protein